MKKYSALLLCTIIFLLPSPASSESILSGLELSLSPGVLVGADVPETAVSGLGVAGELGTGSIATGRAAYFLSDNFGLELNLGLSSNDFDYTVGGVPVTVNASQLHFDVGPIAQYRLGDYIPFVYLGLGLVNIDGERLTVSGQSIAGDTTEVALSVGAGVKYFFAEKLGVQLDIRDHMVFANDDEFWGIEGDETLNLIEISGGFLYSF